MTAMLREKQVFFIIVDLISYKSIAFLNFSHYCRCCLLKKPSIQYSKLSINYTHSSRVEFVLFSSLEEGALTALLRGLGPLDDLSGCSFGQPYYGGDGTL